MSKINLSDPQTFSVKLPAQPFAASTESTNKWPKVIEQSQTHTIETKPEKPSLWKQLKTKARNLSNSTAAFIQRHPHAMKAALTTAVVAVAAGVFFAISKSASSKAPAPSVPRSAEPSNDSVPDNTSQNNGNRLLLKTLADKEKARISSLEQHLEKPASDSSKEALFLEAKQELRQSDAESLPTWKKTYSFIAEKSGALKNGGLDKKEGITWPQSSRQRVVNFARTYPGSTSALTFYALHVLVNISMWHFFPD